MKHYNLITITGILILLLVVGSLYFAGTAQTQPIAQGSDNAPQVVQSPSNTLFSYQGELLDTAGNPVSNAAMPMRFKLYSAATGGSACWTENQTVEVVNGRFHVNIGAITPIPDACLGSDIYLELAINGETLTPRELLTSVVYAVEASTVPNGAITTDKLNIDGPIQMFNNPLRYGLVWPPSYDSRGSRTALPGFRDTLYYATERGIAVTVNRNPDSGSLPNMFNLRPNSYGGWGNVSSTNPVEITITYPSRILLDGVVLSFGDRNSQAIDYTVEYYQDQDNDGVYEWLVIADITGNTNYEMYHPRASWRVQKIRITVTDAGDGDRDQTLKIATIQASSSKYGKSTGPMLDVGGDTMYGTLDMNAHDISGVHVLGIEGAGNASMEIGQVTSGGNMYLDLTEGSAIVFRNRTVSPSREMFKVSRNGDTIIHGNLDLRGSCTASATSEDNGIASVADPTCTGGSLTTGAVVEANLQTPEEMQSDIIERFGLGDLLCWATDLERLEKCDTANDKLVMAVANRNGKPIVMGAEPIKVIGPVQAGDILVASNTAGYAMVNNNPAPGTVIGQALEEFDGESGLIKAMIRKW